MTNQQDAAAAMFAGSCKKQKRPTPTDLSVSSGWGGLQMSIDVGIEKGKTMDVQKCNSALLGTAIMDFFHCQNLPDRAVEFNHFRKILDVAKVVCSKFTVPSRKKIGGEFPFFSLLY